MFLAFLIALLPPSAVFPSENLHTQAAECRLAFTPDNLDNDCWQVCINCHEATVPITPLDIYGDGDNGLCLNCHPEKSAQSGSDFLLALPGNGGNHPVGIDYDPGASRSSLVQTPQGPRLFFDARGLNPRLYCSTCHNAMGDSPRLLRMSNSRSALCFSCHSV